MSAVFTPKQAFGVRVVLLALLALAVAIVALGVWHARAYDHLGEPIAQPIAFSHKHHVGDDGIDCRYCHADVETRPYPGLPATSVCLTCHSQLYRDQAMLQPLRRSIAEHEPIAWRRVHTLPGFVFFNHSVHVAKGVPCVECHGRVDQMPLEWRAAPMQMQWCLACHRDPAPHLRPKSQEFAMDAPPPTPREAGELAREAHLESTRRLTDCSTCHR
jgi:hypothetical protein